MGSPGAVQEPVPGGLGRLRIRVVSYFSPRWTCLWLQTPNLTPIHFRRGLLAAAAAKVALAASTVG